MPIGATIAAVGTIAGGAIAAKGAKDAAGAQASATTKANRESIAFQREQFDRQMEALLPQRIVGEQALFGLSDLVGLSRPTESLVLGEGAGQGQNVGDNVQLTQGVSNLGDLASTPGFQFRLDQGRKAVEASAAAQGLSRSGRGLASVENFAQGIASDEFQNRFNRLATLAGLGSSATGQSASAAGAFGANVGGQIAQTGRDIGAIRASGIAGQANAIGGGLANLGNLAGFAAGGGFGGFGGGGSAPPSNVVSSFGANPGFVQSPQAAFTIGR